MGTGDDFFFTGGGFSDWSGGSAGKFSSGALYDSSSGGKSSNDNDKENSLHHKPKVNPIIISKLGVARRIMMICFLLLMQTFGAIMYIQNPDWEAYAVHGTIFVSSWLYLSWYILKNELY